MPSEFVAWLHVNYGCLGRGRVLFLSDVLSVPDLSWLSPFVPARLGRGGESCLSYGCLPRLLGLPSLVSARVERG
jgi:hypothetical protein